MSVACHIKQISKHLQIRRFKVKKNFTATKHFVISKNTKLELDYVWGGVFFAVVFR